MLSIQIDTDNAAFHDEPEQYDSLFAECSRILRELAERIATRNIGPQATVNLYDVNGNMVGTATFTE